MAVPFDGDDANLGPSWRDLAFMGTPWAAVLMRSCYTEIPHIFGGCVDDFPSQKPPFIRWFPIAIFDDRRVNRLPIWLPTWPMSPRFDRGNGKLTQHVQELEMLGNVTGFLPIRETSHGKIHGFHSFPGVFFKKTKPTIVSTPLHEFPLSHEVPRCDFQRSWRGAGAGDLFWWFLEVRHGNSVDFTMKIWDVTLVSWTLP